MASTAYRDTGARLYLSGYTYTLEGRVNYNVSRTNNTLYFSGVSATVRYGGPSGGAFSWNGGWDIQAMVGTSSARSSGYWSGTRSVGNTNTTGSQSFSIGVSSGTTSMNVRTRGKFRSDGWTYSSSVSISVPALGSPSGTTSIQSGTTASLIPVRNNVTSWGSNAGAGSVRSYIADNSSFSGQSYVTTSDNALMNHTGLTSNKRYWIRGWSSNGGGKSAYMNTVNTYTLPVAPTPGSPTIEATTATIPTTQNAGGGAYSITNQVRWREVGGTWTSWATYTGNSAVLTDLTPSIEYEYQLRSTTTAGTTEGSVRSLSTLPAGKMIMPDGSVINAIPRTVSPNGTVTMVNVRTVQ